MEGGEKKKKSIMILVVCAIVFVTLFAIVNFNVMVGIVSAVLTLLSPLLIGFAIAYVLNPILRLFEFKIYKKIKKKNVNRALSMVSTYIVAALIIVMFLWLLIPSLIKSVVDLISNYHTYVAHTTNFINNIINDLMSNEIAAEYINANQINEFLVNFFTSSGNVIETVTKYVAEYGAGLFVGVKNAVLGIFISIYVLISKEKLQAQVRKFGAAVMSDKKQKRISRYINLTHRTFSSFFIGKIIDSVIILVLTFILMSLFRLEYSLLISVIVGVTNIIPIFGPIIGAIPSFMILFIVEPKQALIFLVLIIIIQQLDGNVIGPKILGDSIGISSLSVIIAIVIMGDLFGVLGMIVGVPIFAVVITVVKELIETKLKKKGKSIDTADYYLKDSAVDPNDKHIPVAKKMFDNIENIAKKIVKVFKKGKSKKNEETSPIKDEEAEESANSEEDEEENKENQ